MNFYLRDQRGYGGVEMFLCAAIIGIVMYFYFYPTKFNQINPDTEISSGIYCRDLVNDPNAPVLTAPSYKANNVDASKPRQYRLVKRNVPVIAYVWTGDVGGADYEHLIHGFQQNYTDPKTGKKYIIKIPNGAGGRSYEYPTSLDPNILSNLKFDEYGLLLAYQVNDAGEPLTFNGGGAGSPHLVDIYKAIDLPPLPEWVTQCVDEAGAVSAGALEWYYPNPSGSPFRAEEQLNWFLFKKDVYLPHAWWVPHCKPAIYLYPETATQVNVQVRIPNGSFLYTDPLYPTGGWNVLAKPSGELTYLGNTFADSKGKTNYPSGIFPYMYYEARIADSAIEKPTTGYSKKYTELASFFDELLPQLGLNSKEAKEFKAYWLKVLPKSTYYFIGIVTKENLDEIEPLTITPQQDTTIRVTLYFEALDMPKLVVAPRVKTPTRAGFTVVEWGGMIKRDKNHPFTCSQ